MSKPKKENNMGEYTIKDFIKKRINHTFFLADIQRDFTWDEERVEKLFDSIYKDYPIGSCIALKQKADSPSNLYSFIKNVEKDKTVGEKRDGSTLYSSAPKELYSVLDGQQRLTAIYIGTQGGYKVWRGSGRRKRDEQPPLRELYFAPKVVKRKGEGIPATFSFFSETELKKQERNWYRVKDIIAITSSKKLEKYYSDNKIDNKYEKTDIETLYETLTQKNKISVFEINLRFDPDDAVDIFLRLNSGGVPLKRTDLLFAIAINNWPEGRDQIDDLISDIRKSPDFESLWDDIDRDFVLRSCLYLTNQPISIKVDDLKTKVDYSAISGAWEDIQTCIKDTLKKLKENGHTASSILSKNAIYPIMYYYYINKNNWKYSQHELNKLFIVSQLNGLFSSSTDRTIVDMRQGMDNFKKKTFSFEEYDRIMKKAYTDKYNLSCNKGIIKSWVEGDQENAPYEKGKETFFILSFLEEYKDKRLSVNEQDHLHPYSAFDNNDTRSSLKKTGIKESVIDDWKEKRDYLGNLWLLTGIKNRNKLAKPLTRWIKDNKLKIIYDPAEEIKKDPQYKKGDDPYDFKYFPLFIEKRNQLLIEAIEKVLL